ncbi:MAG: hypothetical protein KME29_29965 [Calothrix sp. FI2-JRJ7]|jgi:hypothetical protein|nr:hypothetical protein [Calothrix sp. FI2-JRJ7]
MLPEEDRRALKKNGYQISAKGVISPLQTHNRKSFSSNTQLYRQGERNPSNNSRPIQPKAKATTSNKQHYGSANAAEHRSAGLNPKPKPTPNLRGMSADAAERWSVGKRSPKPKPTPTSTALNTRRYSSANNAAEHSSAGLNPKPKPTPTPTALNTRRYSSANNAAEHRSAGSTLQPKPTPTSTALNTRRYGSANAAEHGSQEVKRRNSESNTSSNIVSTLNSVGGNVAKGVAGSSVAFKAEDIVRKADVVRRTNDFVRGRTTVYRVEGTPNARVSIKPGGQVAIQGNNSLFLNFGQRARAEDYLARKVEQRLPDARIKSFKVPRNFLNEIRTSAVDESLAKKSFPDRPFRVDVTKAPDQFGLRKPQIQTLRSNIIQGSGKVESMPLKLRLPSGAAQTLSTVGKFARPVALVTDTIRLADAVHADGGRFGRNTAVTTGSVAGGWGGAAAGAAAGAAIGSVIPGVGTVAGGIVGGIAGGFGGSAVGEKIGKWFSR